MQDKEILDLIVGETERQRDGLELIPSENYVSREVLDAMGSIFTNKYSEGYPGRRYYGGQEFTDQVETLAIERAKQLFGADHANVQPHSGAQANNAVYNAWLEPGDTVLGMDLGHGGHLTHGAPVTQSAKVYNFIRYGMKDVETGEIDYDELEELALKHKPKIILVGYSAYSRIPDFARFAAIGKKVDALLMADMAHVAGLIAGGAHPNPFDFGFHVITTTTHKTLRGPRGGLILSKGTVGNPLKKPEHTIENIPTLIDRSVFPGTQGGPLMHVIAAKAVSFHEALQPQFKTYAAQVVKNASVLAEAMKKRGFKLITGGTDNHLILTDVKSSFGVHGGIVEKALDEIGLTANKNAIPNDPEPPFRPSGLRLGTPAMTTRGLVESDMDQIAEWMLAAIENRDDATKLSKIHDEVIALARKFPLPSDKAK
ncbi:serine hydroxymethyltransferase [Candidatus Saccharibacteria bacterium]|jgi:glycine hydroxymethyltransferase|nr:MAG: serine hydroxymethyltransferase [Candidatus Saccharibacteria bacterium]HMU12146.1 serine hydroxymethyltransferase [Candidatus Nanoperiomorbaceae bacterium]